MHARLQPRPTPGFRFPRSTGFSLIELLGVVSVLGILAAVIAPNLARKVSRNNGDREEKLLATLANAILEHTRANQSIPGTGTWAAAAGSIAGFSPNEAARVDPANSATARVYLVHPSFSPSSLSTGVLSDPIWTQTLAGASSIANARILLISVHKAGLTLPVSSGVASSTTAFDNIWNWNFNASTRAPPDGWPSTWTGNGEYLHVRRINFAPLFCRAVFNNAMYPDEVPYIGLGTSTPTLFNTAAVGDTYFLKGTLLRFYLDNEASSTPGTLDLGHTILGNVNFIYEDDHWHIP